MAIEVAVALGDTFRPYASLSKKLDVLVDTATADSFSAGRHGRTEALGCTELRPRRRRCSGDEQSYRQAVFDEVHKISQCMYM